MITDSFTLTSRKQFIRDNQDIIESVSIIAHNLKLYVNQHIVDIGYLLTLDLRRTVNRAIKELEALRHGASRYIEKTVNRVNGCFALPKDRDKSAIDHRVEAQRAKAIQELQNEFRKNYLEWQEYSIHYSNTMAENKQLGASADFERYLGTSTDCTAEWLLKFYECRIEQKILAIDLVPAWFDFMIQKYPTVEDILPGITQQLRAVREVNAMNGTSRYQNGWLPGVTLAGEKITSDYLYRCQVLGMRRGQDFPDDYEFKVLPPL
jgi:hypothetical protein